MSLLRISSLLAVIGISLGAFGAHALSEKLTALGSVETWETAVFYHMIHAVALFSLACWDKVQGNTFSRWAGRCWIGGVFLFSGSLYLLSLFKCSILGPITPIGGLLFIIGWGILFFEGSSKNTT